MLIKSICSRGGHKTPEFGLLQPYTELKPLKIFAFSRPKFYCWMSYLKKIPVPHLVENWHCRSKVDYFLTLYSQNFENLRIFKTILHQNTLYTFENSRDKKGEQSEQREGYKGKRPAFLYYTINAFKKKHTFQSFWLRSPVNVEKCAILV